MIRIPLLTAALLAATASPLLAKDARLATRLFNPDEVVRVEGKMGVQASIAFAESEKIASKLRKLKLKLSLATGLDSRGVRKALDDLEQLGLLENDSRITAYVRVGVPGASEATLAAASRLEVALLDVLREAAPDAGPDAGLVWPDAGESGMGAGV